MTPRPFLASLIALSCYAAPSEGELFTTLTDEMSMISQSAKTRRANIDYLPYIMTVFDADELAHSGASTLKDALALAAGVNIASDNLGLSNPVFRGSNPTAYGQSKLIVDGIEVNDLFFDGYTAYLAMPIDMIKRIEIVRGPGSYSDGHWGYAGSIIVTTVKGEPDGTVQSKGFISAGTYGTRKAGAVYTAAHDDFALAVDAYVSRDDLSLAYGPDGLANNLLGAVNAPLSRSGKAPSQTEAAMTSLALTKGNFFADGRLSSYRHGSAGGINYALASDSDHYDIDQWQIRTGIRYTVAGFSGKLQASAVQDSFSSRQLLAPAGLRLPSLTPPTTVVTYPDGFYGIHDALIRTSGVAASLAGAIGGGELTANLTGSWSGVVSEKTITTDRDTGTGLKNYSASLPFFNPDGFIGEVRAFASYERPLSDSLTGYASLTADSRNGLATQTDPRLAAVYAVDPANLIKVSVSRAHRNPSWQEMFTLNNKARWGNPDLHPETVLAYEAQFIHRFGTEHTVSVNVFYLSNNDQISLRYNTALARYEYVNGSKSIIRGIEGEWRKRYDATSFYAAYTRLWTDDTDGNALADAPADTLRGFITRNLDELWYGSLAGRWQSAAPRAVNDPRSDMKAVGTVDASIGYKLPRLRSELQLTVKNLFDARELYPSPAGTYTGDYPSVGRSFLATLRGTF